MDAMKNFKEAWQLYNETQVERDMENLNLTSRQTSKSKETKTIGKQIEDIIETHGNYNGVTDSLNEHWKSLKCFAEIKDKGKVDETLQTLNNLEIQEIELKKSLNGKQVKLKELLDEFTKKYDDNELIRLASNYLK